MSRIARCTVLVLALVCLLAGGGAAAQPVLPAEDATFVLLVVTPEGQPSALGTAFFTGRDGTALTNSHVVRPVSLRPDRYSLLAIVGGEFYSARIVCAATLAYEPKKDSPVVGRDVAEIRLGPSRFGFTRYTLGTVERTAHLAALPSFPTLRLGDDPARGAAVRIVGFGVVEEHLRPTPGVRWTATGTVDAVGLAPDGTAVFRVASTNRPRQGNSGSPVLDAAGRVAGMWTWNEDDNLAFGLAIGSSALKQPCAGGHTAGALRLKMTQLPATPVR